MAHRSYTLADGSTVYAALYHGPDGRRRTERVATVPEGAPKRDHTTAAKRAELKAAEQRAAVRNGTWVDPHDRTEARTFGELVKLFLANYRSASGKVAFYRQQSKVWLAHIPATLPAVSVTVQHVDRLKRERSRKVGPSTVRKDLASLGKLFRWAEARDYVARNPASPDRVPRPSEPKRDRGYLTDDQEAALLAVCAPWLSRVVRWAINTGMDRSEVLVLSWAAIDDQAGVITAPRGKTGTDRRIPINSTLRGILAEARRVRSVAAAGRVFLDDDGQPVTVERIKSALRRAYPRAGLPLRAPFKVFRHTFASRLVMAGVDAPTVARLLGHTTLAVTDAYMHLSPAHLRGAMERLESRSAAQ